MAKQCTLERKNHKIHAWPKPIASEPFVGSICDLAGLDERVSDYTKSTQNLYFFSASAG